VFPWQGQTRKNRPGHPLIYRSGGASLESFQEFTGDYPRHLVKLVRPMVLSSTLPLPLTKRARTMLKNSATEYGTFSKALHWLMAAIILTLIAVGIYMADLPTDTAEQKQYAFQFFNLHKSFGVVVLVLIVVRLAWLRISPAPLLPDAFAAKEKMVVKALQGVLYLLMVLVPLSGYLMSNAGGHPINFFGMGELPALIGKSKGFGEFAHEMHEILGWSILFVIILHMAGAIKHRLKDKGGETDILKRML